MSKRREVPERSLAPTLAESWPATVKLKPLAAAGSCWPLLRRPETRGIPAIAAPLKPARPGGEWSTFHIPHSTIFIERATSRPTWCSTHLSLLLVFSFLPPLGWSMQYWKASLTSVKGLGCVSSRSLVKDLQKKMEGEESHYDSSRKGECNWSWLHKVYYYPF